MAIDYRERRPVNKNKPRRQPVGKYLAGVVAIVAVIFAAGFAGGWFACWFKMKKSTAILQANMPPTPAASTGTQPPPLPAVPKGQQTPLTFYETLPKGGKAVIGSGINANLPEHQPPAVKQPAAQPQPAPAPAKPAPASQPEKKPVPPAPEKPAPAAKSAPDSGKKFSVQVASVKDKADAESLRNKLAAKGLNPMIIVVNIPEKGVVYRVRAGKKMTQRDAQELAAKLGSGAIAVPE